MRLSTGLKYLLPGGSYWVERSDLGAVNVPGEATSTKTFTNEVRE